MNAEIVGLVFGFVVLPALCIGLEKVWPQLKNYETFRDGFGADVIWYFTQTFVSRIVAPWLVFFVVLPVFLIGGLSLDHYWEGFGPLSRLPFPAQVATSPHFE